MGATPENLAQTLVGRHAERRRREEARAETLLTSLRSEVSALVMQGAVERAWLIGSLAWGHFGSGSDVDLVVQGVSEDLAPTLWDELTGRLGAQVDLLRMETLGEAFAERVRSEGIALHDG